MLHPLSYANEIRNFDSQRGLAIDLVGKWYLPIFLGLNNSKKTNYARTPVQTLAYVRPLRDFLHEVGEEASQWGVICNG